MVATDDYRESASLRGNTRHAVRQNLNGASLVQGSGEYRLGLPSLNGVNFSKRLHTPECDADQPPPATMSLHDAEWTIIEPVPPKALSTVLPPSPVKATSENYFEIREGAVKQSKRTHTEEVAHESGSHSTLKSCETSSRNMSLDSKTTVYKESFDPIRYQYPEIPSIEPTAQAGEPLSNPGISEQDLKLLLKLRRRVQLLRLQVLGQRRIVEVKRGELSDADEQYIKRIRTNHVVKDIEEQTDNLEALVLEDLWRSCQRARDEFGPAEDSLLSMEKRVQDEEHRLERVEERVYKRLQSSLPASQLISSLVSENESISERGSDEDSSESSSTGSGLIDDADYDDYLWRLGNLDLLQERRQDLLNEKSMLEEEQEKRSRVGMDLGAESLDFVNRFDDIISPVELEIEEVSRDVERLKMVCVKKGLIDATGDPIRVSVAKERSAHESPGREQSTLRVEQSKPSQIQLPSGNNELAFRISTSHGGFGPFINLWLLHNLRSSALEILLLACCVAMAISDMDSIDWKAEAMRLWEIDGAGGARPDQPWNESESSETSIPQYSTGTRCEEEENLAIAKRSQSLGQSLGVRETQVSFDINSFLRRKAKSAF